MHYRKLFEIWNTLIERKNSLIIVLLYDFKIFIKTKN